ncbi:hypothetical protein [Burkholderia sp. 8Y]|uniref:hypothetical protein n=1 Tax=Burkholderia sp. 8Y TaxID=2653133 RepID=UPI00135CC023|nr:hypothetical protein [Burkholderia sp. 8Y]
MRLRIGTSIYAIVFLLTIFSTPVRAQQDLSNQCRIAFDKNVADIDFSDKEESLNAAGYSLLCDDKGEKKTFNASFDLKGVEDAIPWFAKGGGGSTEDKQEHFCNAGYNNNQFKSKNIQFHKTVMTSNLNAMLSCFAMASGGMLITHTYSKPDLINIDLTFGSKFGNGVLENVAYNKRDVKCSTKDFSDDGTPQDIGSDTPRKTFDKDVSIECHRLPVKEKGKEYFRQASITVSVFASNVKVPYSIYLEPDQRWGIELRSNYDEALRQLKEELGDSNQSLLVSQSQYKDAQAHLQGAQVVKAELFYVGESDNVNPVAQHVHCGADHSFAGTLAQADKWGKDNCPAGTISLLMRPSQKADAEGNMCGYHFFLNTCLKK